MLQQEGNDTNCFVSLIVDTPGNYQAAITRKFQKVTEVVTKSLGTSYEFFGEGSISTNEDPMSESTKEVTTEVIEYFMLNVEREITEEPLAYLDKRFEEIQAKKEEQKKKTINLPKVTQSSNVIPKASNYASYWDDDYHYGWDYDLDKQKKKEESKQENEPTLWDKKTMDEMKVSDGTFTPNPILIHDAICRMLTCSMIINTEKFDLGQWIKKHMVNKYEELFPDLMAFENWKDFIVDHSISFFTDPDVPEEYIVEMYDEWQFSIAKAMKDELSEYESNTYIESYIKDIDRWIN